MFYDVLGLCIIAHPSRNFHLFSILFQDSPFLGGFILQLAEFIQTLTKEGCVLRD